jgi:hypothetical protein
LRIKKLGLELGLALAAGPLGNLAAEKADRPKALAWRGGGGILPEEITLKKILEEAGRPEK